MSNFTEECEPARFAVRFKIAMRHLRAACRVLFLPIVGVGRLPVRAAKQSSSPTLRLGFPPEWLDEPPLKGMPWPKEWR